MTAPEPYLPGPLLPAVAELQRRGRGALLVADTTAAVLSLATGGFPTDVAATPERLVEAAKMDGAVLLADASRIVRLNAHLNPPPLPTERTGTRHRTADRLSRAAGVTVVAISAHGTATVFPPGRDVDASPDGPPPIVVAER